MSEQSDFNTFVTDEGEDSDDGIGDHRRVRPTWLEYPVRWVCPSCGTFSTKCYRCHDCGLDFVGKHVDSISRREWARHHENSDTDRVDA